MYKIEYHVMTTGDYRAALDAAIKEYEALGEERRAIDKRLADVAQTIGTLSRLIGLVPTVPLGLTDGCRLVLRSGVPMTPTEVREQLAVIGLDLAKYASDMAAIHTVLKRLNEAGAVLVAKLSLGALAMNDIWFGGQTMNPWLLEEGASGSSAGPGAATLALPGVPPFAPLICYEAIFPGAVVDMTRRPDWLLNVTNDAWYGRSSGPFQHFAIARTRAVEEGLPLVRVANNGVSAVIDAQGRVEARLALDAVGYADVALPVPLEPTLYARTGDWTLLTLLLIGAIPLALRFR